MLSANAVFALAAVLTFPANLCAQQAPNEKPVSVMVVGDFHMSNPGQDIHNL